MFDIKEIRAVFPHTKETSYFNAASNGPLSNPGYKAQEAIYIQAKSGRMGRQVEVYDALDNIRRNGARIFGARKKEVGFGFNTTFGINLAAFGLPLKKGDEVLLSDVEFPANVYPWLELRNRGIKVKFLKSNRGCFDIEALQKAITKKTKVLSLSFVQYFNGYKNDMTTIGAICKAHDIFFVVDAIQGAGCEPMNVRKWQVDIASTGGHKWLLGPQGTGIFFVSDNIKDRFRPPWRSWLGVDWKCDWSNLNDFERPFDDSARQFEMGTYPAAHVMALDWSLEFINQLGVRNIQKHNYAQMDKLIDLLKAEPFYRITGSVDKKHRSSIISFTTHRGDIDYIHRLLLYCHIITAMREGSIRVSTHLYNDESDMRRLIICLEQAAMDSCCGKCKISPRKKLKKK